MESGGLGKVYRDGEIIVREGEVGDTMYVIQSGQVDVFRESAGKDVHVSRLGQGEMFGEMAIIEKEVRSASVRAVGEVRVLTIDKTTFLRRVHEDPSLAYRVMRKMSSQIRELTAELVEARGRK